MCAGAILACAGLTEPTPFQGDASFKLTLRADSPTADVDARRIVARLYRLGVGAESVAMDATTIQLTVTGAKDLQSLEPVFAANRLSFGFPNQSLDNTAVESASVPEPGPFGPRVEVALTPEASDTFCALTKAHIKEKMAITLDGEVKIEPVIQEAICGGRVAIEMGRSPTAYNDALSLAASLGVALESTWLVYTPDSA